MSTVLNYTKSAYQVLVAGLLFLTGCGPIGPIWAPIEIPLVGVDRLTGCTLSKAIQYIEVTVNYSSKPDAVELFLEDATRLGMAPETMHYNYRGSSDDPHILESRPTIYSDPLHNARLEKDKILLPTVIAKWRSGLVTEIKAEISLIRCQYKYDINVEVIHPPDKPLDLDTQWAECVKEKRREPYRAGNAWINGDHNLGDRVPEPRLSECEAIK